MRLTPTRFTGGLPTILYLLMAGVGSAAESAAEAMADLGERNAGNDHAVRDETVTLPWLGTKTVGPSGFRFVRIDAVDPDRPVRLTAVQAVLEIRDVPRLGSFRSSDPRLNRIWEAGREHFYEYHSDESADDDTVLFHALGAWRVRPAFHDLLWNPAFLVPAYQLLGSGFRLLHDQLFSKPARHGGVVAWHQDYSYWTWTAPMAHLTCWIALDDVDETNGCLHYIPGSHRWGLVEKTALAGDMEAVRERLAPDQRADFDRTVPIVLRRGEASFHHPLLMHGSYANRSERPRRATVINVLADGVCSWMDSFDPANMPGANTYPAVPKGEPMSGPYDPLLFDPGVLSGLAKPLPTLDSI